MRTSTLTGTTSRRPPSKAPGDNSNQFEIGDTVALKDKVRLSYSLPRTDTGLRRTKIKALFKDVKGLVLLEDQLSGYWTWNINDLVLIKKGEINA